MIASLFISLALTVSSVGDGNLKLSADNIPQIVSAMTLEEKVRLIIGYTKGSAQAAGDVGFTEKRVPGAAGATGEVGRLGIPSIILADGPAGLRINPERKGESRTYYCTGFPIGTLLSSTWNVETVAEVGAAMGNEVLEYGVDVLLAPGVNIQRNPLCGRNFEYFSEDPVLAGEIAAAYINGVQSQGVGTSLKHFAANNQELNRLSNNSIVSENVLREIYLKNFEIAVRKSHPWTIMSSYNFINGVHAAENKWLLTDVLRKEWGYDGAVMTDWGGGYRFADVVAAGNDMIQSGSAKSFKEVFEAAKNGSLPMSAVDSSAARILRLIVKTPTFRKYRYSENPDLKAHALVSRRAAEEGIILLKRSALPLRRNSNVALFGVSSYDFIAGGTGSGDVNKPYVVDLREGMLKCGFTLNRTVDEFYEGYMKLERKRCKQVDAEKKKWYIDAERPLDAAPSDVIETAAQSAESAVITIGRISGEGRDRLAAFGYVLSEYEIDLIRKVSDAFHKRGKKLTVLLDVCGVVEVSSWEKYADDIVLCWLPGQEGGSAVANVLSGKVNPSGRLPMTFPVRYEDDPTARNFPQVLTDKVFNYSFYRSLRDGKVRNQIRNIDYTEYAEGLFVGYRYYSTEGVRVQYPFGYGLSYTDFSWGKTSVSRTDGGWNVSVTVRNVGKCAGKDVVEVYLMAPKSEKERPSLELKGFAKTGNIAPGDTETVRIFIPESECSTAVCDGRMKKGWSLAALKNAGFCQ